METIQSINAGRTASKAGGDKRELILEAALELFRQNGFRRTSMEDIAEAADIAKGTLYLYFKSKEELFAALGHNLVEQVIGAMTEANIATAKAGLEDRLLTLVDAKIGFFHRWINSSPHGAELIASGNQICEEGPSRVDRQFRENIAEILREAAEKGQISAKAAGVSLATSADAIITAVQGAKALPVDEAAFDRNLRAIVRLMARGLRP